MLCTVDSAVGGAGTVLLAFSQSEGPIPNHFQAQCSLVNPQMIKCIVADRQNDLKKSSAKSTREH